MKQIWEKTKDCLKGLMNLAFVAFFFGGICAVIVAIAMLMLGVMGLIAYLAVELCLNYTVVVMIGVVVLFLLYFAIWPDGWEEPAHRNFTQPNQPKAGWAIQGVVK